MTADAVAVLQHWYSRRTGQWRSTGWWNAANALTAVIRYTALTGDQAYRPVIGNTFARAPRRHPGFINTFFDDNGWWALAWVAAYDLDGDPGYLEAAEAIFARNRTGWDDTCGGGLWWNEERTYKNAITCELFLLLAGLLAQRVPGRGDYLDWALRSWDWLRGSGMINPDALVNDGLSAACANNGQPAWTYNQGVILGGLTALHEITGDAAYLGQAQLIADAAVSRLTDPPGILADPGERADAGGDLPQFKGIFARYLGDLARSSAGDPRQRYAGFLTANADRAWDRDRNAAGQFGLRWGGPFDRADASRQSAAAELLTAAAAVSPPGVTAAGS